MCNFYSKFFRLLLPFASLLLLLQSLRHPLPLAMVTMAMVAMDTMDIVAMDML